MVVCEAQDTEEYGEDKETADLKGFSAYGVDGEDRGQVAGKGPGDGQYYETYCVVVEFVVESFAVDIACRGEDDGIVQP